MLQHHKNSDQCENRWTLKRFWRIAWWSVICLNEIFCYDHCCYFCVIFTQRGDGGVRMWGSGFWHRLTKPEQLKIGKTTRQCFTNTFSSCLTGVEPDMIVCCWVSTSRFDVFWDAFSLDTIVESSYLSYHSLSVSSNQFWSFSSDLSNQQSFSAYRTIPCCPQTSMPHSKSLRSYFSPFWCLTWILTEALKLYLVWFYALCCCYMIGSLDKRMNKQIYRCS